MVVAGDVILKKKEDEAPKKDAGTFLMAYRREKLADLCQTAKKDKVTAETEATLWTAKNIPADAHSVVVAGSQILVAGTSEVVVLDETGQKELAILWKRRPATVAGRVYCANPRFQQENFVW